VVPLVPVVRAVTLLPVAPTDPVARAVTLATVGWAARPLRVGSPVRPALMVVMAVTRVRQPSVVWPVPAVPVARRVMTAPLEMAAMVVTPVTVSPGSPVTLPAARAARVVTVVRRPTARPVRVARVAMVASVVSPRVVVPQSARTVVLAVRAAMVATQPRVPRATAVSVVTAP
jgi:hypothetical protein